MGRIFLLSPECKSTTGHLKASLCAKIQPIWTCNYGLFFHCVIKSLLSHVELHLSQKANVWHVCNAWGMSAQVTMNSHYCLHLTIRGDKEKEKMMYVMHPQAIKSVMTLSLVKDPSRKQRSSSSFQVKSCSLVTRHPVTYLSFAFVPSQIAFSQHNSIMDLVQFFVTFFRWVLVPSLFLTHFKGEM